MGADRPGIVAAVTGVLVEQGCNLEDTSMTILRGHFAMMLVVDMPHGLTAEVLEGALAVPAYDFDLVVTVRAIPEAVEHPTPGDPWTLSVYGADRPGIVHGVAALLAQERVNIVDLSTRVIGDPSQPVYAMALEIAVPPQADPDDLRQRLEALVASLGVDCSLHPADADIL